MDTQYIGELRVLEDKKEAKTKLIEYAEQFDIKLKKTKSFDNLVLDIEEAFKELQSEPIPEADGLSISDLIDADDESKGLYVANEVKPEARLLFDGPVGEYQVEVIDQPEAELVEKGEVVKVKLIEEDIPFVEEKFKETVTKVIESEKPVFSLPENFSPNLQLIGKNPGFVTVPWWIYQWISETPDWKERPTSFQHPTAHQTLFSLIYYINRNGSVLVRETRNSSFVTLK